MTRLFIYPKPDEQLQDSNFVVFLLETAKLARVTKVDFDNVDFDLAVIASSYAQRVSLGGAHSLGLFWIRRNQHLSTSSSFLESLQGDQQSRLVFKRFGPLVELCVRIIMVWRS
jgi:hypothetical protein